MSDDILIVVAVAAAAYMVYTANKRVADATPAATNDNYSNEGYSYTPSSATGYGFDSMPNLSSTGGMMYV